MNLQSFQRVANAALKELQLLDTLPDCLLLGFGHAKVVYHRNFFEITWCQFSPNSRGIPGELLHGARSQT